MTIIATDAVAGTRPAATPGPNLRPALEVARARAIDQVRGHRDADMVRQLETDGHNAVHLPLLQGLFASSRLSVAQRLVCSALAGSVRFIGYANTFRSSSRGRTWPVAAPEDHRLADRDGSVFGA